MSGSEENKNALENALLNKNQYICVQVNFYIREVLFPMRIEGDLSSNKITILYNGAVLKDKKLKPIFQRSSWVKDLGCLVINIDDPTINLHTNIVVGWGQGTLDDYYSIQMSKN